MCVSPRTEYLLYAHTEGGGNARRRVAIYSRCKTDFSSMYEPSSISRVFQSPRVQCAAKCIPSVRCNTDAVIEMGTNPRKTLHIYNRLSLCLARGACLPNFRIENGAIFTLQPPHDILLAPRNFEWSTIQAPPDISPAILSNPPFNPCVTLLIFLAPVILSDPPFSILATRPRIQLRDMRFIDFTLDSAGEGQS